MRGAQRQIKTVYKGYPSTVPFYDDHKLNIPIFHNWRRIVSNGSTLQYDKVIYLIESANATANLAGKNVITYDYSDSTLSIKHCGKV